MHYLMDNPYISHSYMTYWMEDEEEERGRGGGGRRRRGRVEEEEEGRRARRGHNSILKQSLNFDGG